MSNFDLTQFEQGIQILEKEYRTLLINGYTNFFHSMSPETISAGQAAGLNFQEIYSTTIQSLKNNIDQSKNDLALLKKYL